MDGAWRPRGERERGVTLLKLSLTAGRGLQCRCDPGWTGSSCQSLDFLPLPNVSESGLPLPAGVVSVWGGSIIEDPNSSDLWHMYAAMMVESCPLTTWKLNSVIVHATASSPIGPYRVRDEVMKGTIKLVKCHTDDNISDIYTKVLDKAVFERHRDKLVGKD